MSPSVLVRGSFSEGNFGDDALLVACTETLARIFDPHDIRVLCGGDAPWLQTLHPKLNVVSTPEGQRVDLVVYGGGTQFFSFPLTRFGWSRRLRTAALSPVATARRLIAKRRAMPAQRTAALGIGIGPFVDDQRRQRATRELFRALDFVAVRDRESLRFCRSWGVEAVVGADLCFLPGSWRTPTPAHAGGRRAGIIVRDWPHSREGAAYAVPLQAAAQQLEQQGVEVTFISFCSRSDQEWLAQLNARGHRPIVWNPNEHTIADFCRQLAGFDVLVTARYHGAIFGALLGRPTVCIEVEPKLRLVHEMLGAGSRLWAAPFLPAACAQTVIELLGSPEPARVALAEAVSTQDRLAVEMLGEFERFCCDSFLRRS